MPTVRIPLVGSFNQRGLDGSAALTLNQDQRFKNCEFEVVTNPVTGKSTVYVKKRAGWVVDSTVSSGIASTGLIKPQAFNATLTAFGETNSVVYVGTTMVGNMTGRGLHFTENIVSGVSHVDIKSSDGTGWYYVDGARDVTSYSVRISTSSFILIQVSSTAGIYPGQLFTGTGIGAGARVTSVNSAASTIGLNVTSNTASTSTITITKEPIAQILDPNFVSTGTYRSAFTPMDGYLFYATDDGKLRNSDLNTDIVYSANSNIAVQMSPDPTVAVATQKNTVIAFGLNSKEVFYNAGLATGSPLQRSPQFFDRIGCLDQRSVTQIENEIYFVSSPYEGDVGVYKIKDLQAQKISTPVIDRIIGTVAGSGAIYANSFRYGGYPYAGFVLSTAADGPASFRLIEGSADMRLAENGNFRTLEDQAAQVASFVRFLVYNIQLNIWDEWDCNQCTFIDSIGSGTNNQIIATSRMNPSGKIYRIDPVSDGSVFTDDGVGYLMEVRTAKLDMGTSDKKYVREINLIGDTVSSSTMASATIYYSDDDYKTWSQGQTFDLSRRNKNVFRLGSHYDGRAYKLTVSGGPFRAEALEIRYDKGLS